MKREILIQAFLFLVVTIGIAYIYTFSGETKFKDSVVLAEEEIANIYSSFDEIAKRKDLDLSSLNSDQFDKLNNDLPFDLFISEKGKLIFWSKNKAVPADLNIQSLTEDAKLVSLKNGYYIALKKSIDDKEYVALSLIRKSYSLVNKYLTNSYSKQYDFQDNDVILPASLSAGEAIKDPKGNTIFRIQQEDKTILSVDTLRLVISFLVIVLAFIYIYQFSIQLRRKYNNVSIGLFSLIVFGFLWLGSIIIIPFEFKKLVFFDSGLFGSSLFSSLGYLFFSVAFYFSISYFYFINVLKGRVKPTLITKILSSIVLVGSFIFSAIILKSLVLDSIINYGAKNLALLNSYALFGVTVAFFISIVFVFIATAFVFLFKDVKNFWAILFSYSILVFLALRFIAFGHLNILLTALFFLFIYFLYRYIFVNKKSSVILLIGVSIFFSVIMVSSITRTFTIDKSKIAKRIIASKKSRQRDVNAEDMYSQLEKKIREDEFVKKFFQNPMISYKDIYKRMTSRYFDGYYSKYDVNVVPFNINGKPIKYSSKETLENYYENINKYGESTITENLVFIQDKEEQYSYISLLQIENENEIVGTLAIKISPKTYDSGNFYPELLLEGKNDLIDQYNDDFEFAIYYDNVLVTQSSEFAYSSKLDENVKEDYSKDGFNHSLYEIDGHKKIIVSSKQETIMDMFSVFSFVLCFYFLLGFFVTIFYFRLTNEENSNMFNFSFRKKINIAMLLLVILSFLVIGMATVSYFSTQYDTYHQMRLIRKEKSISSALKYVLEKKNLQETKKFKNYFANSLRSDIIEISDIHKMDINIFDLNGSLITSSQDGIFTSGLLSNIINPKAFVLLKNEKKSLVSQEENIGNLKYLSIYVPILNDVGDTLAYLNIPYFAKEKNLSQDISDFMISLVNVYVLLLLVASIIAFFVSNSITNPLKAISEKLKEITLTKRNAKIEWDADDEIGGLVKEYNSMIGQLDHSASLLAKSERDTAWREMAKQIAHEIKNPLTPMKLSIQYLQRALNDDPEQGTELVNKVSKTLIEQINNLSDISTAFSSFAKMPKGDRTNIDLIEVVDSAVDLFNRDSLNIIKKYNISSAVIFADKNQMISVFNNLIKNAIQATEEKENEEIIVEITAEHNLYRVSIRDNGVGISEEKASKVFVPNFTTKSSGTGLGLAISKQIIEGLEGDIYFESVENEYTVFRVNIPITNKN